MSVLERSGPIVAVSTGTQEKAAIGIIRISGFWKIDFLADLCQKKGSLEPRKAYFRKFYDSSGELLDEGLVLYFKGPHSFTGENLVELHVHGNPFNMERIIKDLVDRFGFQSAYPGEFSYRALKNGKLNLSQVEGLDLLLNSNSGFGLSSATKVLNNDLHKHYISLRDHYLNISACIELGIDFSEDVGQEELDQKMKHHIAGFDQIINQLFKRSQGSLSDLMSPKICLIGPTNAGKSTFFNKLLGHNRAIVSDIHGTTRDFVSEYIYLEGYAFQLIDTAGLRKSDNAIEQEGIKRSLELGEGSFFNIFVWDPTSDNSLGALDKLLEKSRVDALLLTHGDKSLFDEGLNGISKKFPNLPIFKSELGPIGPEKSGPIEPENSGPMGAKIDGPIEPKNSGPIGPSLKCGPIGAAKGVSGPIEPGIFIENFIFMKYQSLMKENPIPIQRHRDVISSIYQKWHEFLGTYEGNEDVAVLDYQSRILGASLDELIGIVSPQEVLDHIFANFCIGK